MSRQAGVVAERHDEGRVACAAGIDLGQPRQRLSMRKFMRSACALKYALLERVRVARVARRRYSRCAGRTDRAVGLMLGVRFWLSTAESLVTPALMLRTALMPLPGCASIRMMPSACGRSGERIAALDELAGLLAERHALLGDRLVEGHGRPAAAMAQQHHLGDAGLAAQVVHAGLHVERVVFPRRASGLVVVATRVHPEHDEAARGKLRVLMCER